MKIYFQKGFTLIELLIVIAIIGTLSGIVLASSSGSRTRAADNVIKSDLNSIAKQAEIYHSNNSTYGTFAQATCPSSTGGGNNIFQADSKMLDIIRHAYNLGSNASSCVSGSETYAIAIGLKTSGQSLCVDHTKIVRQSTGTPAAAITGGQCN